MSIYSGFATRQQQQTYDHCINSLLYILQKRVLKFYNNEKTDEYKFANLVQKIFIQMKNLEKAKYLDPKCSFAFQQLFEFLIKENFSEQNATNLQNSLINQHHQNIKQKVRQKKPGFQSNYSSSSKDCLASQKNYQIPIRIQNSPSRSQVRSNVNSQQRHIGKIVSSKSKQKGNSFTISHTRAVVRQQTPSAQGSRLFNHNKILPNSTLTPTTLIKKQKPIQQHKLSRLDQRLSPSPNQVVRDESRQKLEKLSSRMKEYAPKSEIKIIDESIQAEKRIWSSKGQSKMNGKKSQFWIQVGKNP